MESLLDYRMEIVKRSGRCRGGGSVMRGMPLGLFMAAALFLGGCASGPYRKEVGRLRAEVGLLDDRVTQLERASGANNGPLATAPLSEPDATSEPMPTPSESAKPAPSLKPTTREIQQALKNAGFYPGAVDGNMGAVTREAVQEFQRIHGLIDDVVVGKRTWAKLRAFVDLSGKHGEASAGEILK